MSMMLCGMYGMWEQERFNNIWSWKKMPSLLMRIHSVITSRQEVSSSSARTIDRQITHLTNKTNPPFHLEIKMTKGR